MPYELRTHGTNTLCPNTLYPNIWQYIGPDLIFAGAPMHTRMTVVRLSDGTLWIHSPIQISEEVLSFVESQGGEVSAIVAPNKFHHLFVQEWVKLFPNAQVFAEETVKKKVETLAGAHLLTDQPDSLYANDIDQVVVSGNRLFQEVVFFHQDSSTLILTDLIINLKAQNIPLLPKLFLKFEGDIINEIV